MSALNTSCDLTQYRAITTRLYQLKQEHKKYCDELNSYKQSSLSKFADIDETLDDEYEVATYKQYVQEWFILLHNEHDWCAIEYSRQVLEYYYINAELARLTQMFEYIKSELVRIYVNDFSDNDYKYLLLLNHFTQNPPILMKDKKIMQNIRTVLSREMSLASLIYGGYYIDGIIKYYYEVFYPKHALALYAKRDSVQAEITQYTAKLKNTQQIINIYRGFVCDCNLTSCSHVENDDLYRCDCYDFNKWLLFGHYNYNQTKVERTLSKYNHTISIYQARIKKIVKGIEEVSAHIDSIDYSAISTNYMRKEVLPIVIIKSRDIMHQREYKAYAQDVFAYTAYIARKRIERKREQAIIASAFAVESMTTIFDVVDNKINSAITNQHIVLSNSITQYAKMHTSRCESIESKIKQATTSINALERKLNNINNTKQPASSLRTQNNTFTQASSPARVEASSPARVEVLDLAQQ